MSKRNTALYKKSLIAVAVVSLSACSTTPRIYDRDGLSRVGEGILSAGRTTADVTGRVWDRTTYLLGFSDGDSASDENLLMDEVDLAMMEEDPARLPADTTIRPIIIRQAIPERQSSTEQSSVQTPMNPALDLELAQNDLSSDQLNPLRQEGSQLPASGSLAEDLSLPSADQGLLNADADEATVVEDLVHEVASNETLWDISKKITGDATNWHVLADVNNLGPNAAVYPGQQLIIPADMVKPSFDDTLPANTQSASADPSQLDTQNLENPNSRTEVSQNESALPDSKAVERTVAAVTAADGEISGTPFTLNAGETLWDFSKRTTGDATNWQAIASQNEFSEQQAILVRAGQTIFVPEELVKTDLNTAEQNEQTPIKDDLTTQVAANTSDAADSEAIDASTDLLAEAASPLDETQPIKIVEAAYKSDDIVQPIAVEQVTSQSIATDGKDANVPTEIMVSGTYYPKAVYNKADFSSSLLMRVSPGTTLQVSKSMGNWFQVETDKGTGYVHQRDIK